MNSSTTNNRIPRIPILMYHSISEVSERHKKIRSANPAYSLTVNQFREHMEYLHTNRYITLSLDQLLNNESVPQKSLVITFDDGLFNNYTKAFPILRKYGLTATIFVITGFVGQTKYMDWHQLREMSEAGISIQSHTVSHKPLTGLAYDQLMHELSASKKTLEDHLGKHVNFLSLPHGIFNRRVLETAQKAGYEAVCTSEPGFSHEMVTFPVFRRISIPDRYKLATFEKILKKNRMTILPLIFAKKLKNLIKRTVGFHTYRKIYKVRYTIHD